jgi:mannose/fructose/N-acetylgalactosamine-specific phosphotransferase system component IIB
MFFGNLRKRMQGKVMSKAMPPQFRMRMRTYARNEESRKSSSYEQRNVFAFVKTKTSDAYDATYGIRFFA